MELDDQQRPYTDRMLSDEYWARVADDGPALTLTMLTFFISTMESNIYFFQFEIIIHVLASSFRFI